MKHILLIPRIKIHNANALSSPFTIGFPAMTAWLGGVHALQRHLNQAGFADVIFKSTAVISHDCNLQTYKGIGDYIHSIVGTANPLDKKGQRAAFIEEGRCHLVVSLVIEYTGINVFEKESFIDTLTTILHSSMKLASGDILSFNIPSIHKISEENDLKQLLRQLMPGYVITERRDLMLEAMQNGQDALDAILEYLKIFHRSKITKSKDEKGNEKDIINWTSNRKTKGWIVPIATGYQGISPIDYALNQRDSQTPHRFAESLLTLGEFKMVYRIKNLDSMLWHAHVDVANNLYLCQQNTNLTN